MKNKLSKKSWSLFTLRARKTVIALLLILSAVILTACQPTPDKPPILNRAQGWLEDYVIDPLPEGELKQIDAPVHWKEYFELRNGDIVVNADVDITIPEVGNTPVLELEQREFTEAHLSELIRYFAGNNKPYEIPPMTKSELEAELDKMENKEEFYAAPPAAGFVFKVRQLLEDAPEAIETVYIAPVFTSPENNEVDFILNTSPSATSENTYAALVDIGDGPTSLITATKYDTTVGSTSCFSYSRGIVISEENMGDFKNIYDSYSSWVGTRLEAMGTVGITWLEALGQYIAGIEEKCGTLNLNAEWAKQQSDMVLRDLNITHMSLGKQEKGVSFSDDNYKQFRLNYMGVDFEKAKAGYMFTYYRSTEGLQSSMSYNSGGYATPAFCSEIITIFVSEDGVTEFKWYNMSIVVGVIAQNTKLVPFDTVIGSFQDYLEFSCHPEARHRVEITGVSLIAGNTAAYNNPAHAWQVPVWLIEYDYYGEIEPGVEIKTPGGSCMFSAIDGAYMPYFIN